MFPDGRVKECGDISRLDFPLTNEPFDIISAHLFKKNLSSGEWIYLPDVTPADTTIKEVRYDWPAEKVYITIADQYRPGPYEFDCTRTWTDADCQAAIEAKFNNNIQGG